MVHWTHSVAFVYAKSLWLNAHISSLSAFACSRARFVYQRDLPIDFARVCSGTSLQHSTPPADRRNISLLGRVLFSKEFLWKSAAETNERRIVSWTEEGEKKEEKRKTRAFGAFCSTWTISWANLIETKVWFSPGKLWTVWLELFQEDPGRGRNISRERGGKQTAFAPSDVSTGDFSLVLVLRSSREDKCSVLGRTAVTQQRAEDKYQFVGDYIYCTKLRLLWR